MPEPIEPPGSSFEEPRPTGREAEVLAARRASLERLGRERAIANNVLVIPGNVFSERDTHFRISYATTDEKLRQGCEILNSLV